MDGESALWGIAPRRPKVRLKRASGRSDAVSDFTCTPLSESIRILNMDEKTGASKAASLMGKRGYKARLERFGLERLQEIARENGKLGGRPKRTGKKATAKEKAAEKGGK